MRNYYRCPNCKEVFLQRDIEVKQDSEKVPYGECGAYITYTEYHCPCCDALIDLDDDKFSELEYEKAFDDAVGIVSERCEIDASDIRDEIKEQIEIEFEREMEHLGLPYCDYKVFYKNSIWNFTISEIYY